MLLVHSLVPQIKVLRGWADLSFHVIEVLDIPVTSLRVRTLLTGVEACVRLKPKARIGGWELETEDRTCL
jgi:hypothetical protein